MICTDCMGKAPVACPGCDGTGRARDTLPAPPPTDEPTATTAPAVDALGETWPDEAPTGVECPIALRKHHEPDAS